MNGFQKIGVIIAATGMASVLVANGAQTASVAKAIFGGVASWQKSAEGRG